MTEWLAYTGAGEPDPDAVRRPLPEPPPWRDFATPGGSSRTRAGTFRAEPHEIDMVNAALYLRRPLLVTGRPGTGKSSLAYSVAAELALGEVLHWPISSRSTLGEGLYSYDAVARLQDSGHRRRADAGSDVAGTDDTDVGRYLTLGPLGTALLPANRPRVLLVDEFDKGDIDLPNDLLNVVEEGYFSIPELLRRREHQSAVRVMTADGSEGAVVTDGVVRCRQFPLLVITSNGEREFPPAFLRRCLRLEMREPDRDKLTAILDAHLGPDWRERAEWLVDRFLGRRDEGELATDQLLGAVHLVQRGLEPELDREALAARLLPYLDSTTTG